MDQTNIRAIRATKHGAYDAGFMKEGKLSDDAITVDEKGEMLFWGAIRQNPDYVFGLVRFLAVELANTKAELWLQSTNDKKNLESTLEHSS